MSTSSTSREDRQRKIDAATPKERNKVAITIAATLVALLVVAGLVWAWMANRSSDEKVKQETANAATPPNATSDGAGIVANPGKAKPGAPTLVIYEDYQCPICHEVEKILGPTTQKLADSGRIRLEYHVRTFLDANIHRQMQGKEPNPDSSLRASAAAACADTVGAMPAYHATVYENQPEEGKGYTDAQLRDTFAKRAGITGEKLTTFQKCVDEGAMKGYATKMEEAGGKAGNEGTPEYRLNGKTVPLNEVAQNPAALEKLVADATKK